MIATASLLAASAIILLLAPLALTVGRWQVRHPGTALTLWFCAFFAGIALAGASGVTALVSGIERGQVSGAVESLVLTLTGWLSLGAVGAVITLVAASAEPLSESWRQATQRLAPVAISRDSCDGFTLVWFDSDEPIACAVPSGDPEIFVSTGLGRLLSTPQLAAVIEHERAHLRQHHGWAVRIAEINALWVPKRFPAGRAFKRATLLLVELMADDAAARRAGAVHLANALAIIGRATGDPGSVLRAERLSMRNWKPSRSQRAVVLARP